MPKARKRAETVVPTHDSRGKFAKKERTEKGERESLTQSPGQGEESAGVNPRESKSLTARERAFVLAYLAGNTQGRALPSAHAAGYAQSDTGVGSVLLGRPHVKAEIARRLARQDITADKVLAELSRVAYSDMRNYATWGPDGVSLKPSDGLSDLEAVAVAEVSETTTKDGGSLRFKLHDKLGALNTLAKYLRLLTEDDAGGKFVHFHLHTNVDFEKLRGAAATAGLPEAARR